MDLDNKDFEDAYDIALYEEWKELKKDGFIDKTKSFKWYKEWAKKWDRVTTDLLIKLYMKEHKTMDILHIG